MKVKTNLRAGSGGSANSGGVNSGGVNSGGSANSGGVNGHNSSESGGIVVYVPPVLAARCVGY